MNGKFAAKLGPPLPIFYSNISIEPHERTNLDNELPVLRSLYVIQHVLDMQRELKFGMGHVVDSRLLRQCLVTYPNAFGRTSQYVPNLVVKPIWHSTQTTLEFSLLQHVYPANSGTVVRHPKTPAKNN